MSHDALNKEQFFHITDDPQFKPDPSRAPQDNSITLSRIMGPERKGLYVTKNPERWVNAHDYVRPYVAEIHAHPEHVQQGEYHGEGFIPSEHLPHAQVHRVIPLDAHAREEYGTHGWIEEHHETEFDTGKKIPQQGMNTPVSARYPFRGYRYSGPDVRDMTPAQHEQHRQRTRQYLKENRGFSEEELP